MNTQETLRTLLRLWRHRFDVIVLHTSAGKDSQTALRVALGLCKLTF